jgi:hypothetical protein
MNNLRGEFQFEVQKKKYNATISLNSLRLTCQVHKIKLEDLEKFIKEDELTAVAAIAYWGIKNNLILNGKNADKLMSFDMFCAVVMDDEKTFMELAAAVASVLGSEQEEEDSGNE